MWRRRFLALSDAALIARSAARSRKSVEVSEESKSAVDAECEQRLKRIDELRRELAERNRSLELAHRSLAASLERARGLLAREASS
jgi:hypothetical protein